MASSKLERKLINEDEEGFLLSCIAAEIIALQNNQDKKDECMGWDDDIPVYENFSKDLLVTYQSSLEGLLNMLEAESFFFEMTAKLQLEKLSAFIDECSETNPMFKMLDEAYRVLNIFVVENILESRINHIQTAIICMGRLVLLKEKDVIGRLGSQLESEIKCSGKQGMYYVETVVVKCTAFLEDTEQYLVGFYESVSNDLFNLNSESEADMLFQPWALYAVLEWSAFRPLRTIFVNCVIQKLASKINSETAFSNCSILVIDTTLVVANRLRIELFPTCPVTSNTYPTSKGKGLAKDKSRLISASNEMKEDITDPISESLLDTLQRRPETQSLPSILINKTHQRRTAFGVMNRATKNKFRQMFHEWKVVLEQATIGRSIEEPAYCEAIFQLTVIVEQMIQKSNSSQ